MQNLDGYSGIMLGKQDVNNLRYADNTVLITLNKEDLQGLLGTVREESRMSCMELNSKNSEVMVVS